MKVQIVCTHGCPHRQGLEQELRDLGVGYEVVFVEEHPEVAQQYAIRHSPNVVVDGNIVCRGQPTEGELRNLLGLA